MKYGPTKIPIISDICKIASSDFLGSISVDLGFCILLPNFVFRLERCRYIIKDWLIDCQQQTHPLSSSSSSLYGKKTCKKEQEEEKKEAIWKQRRRRIKTSSKLKNHGLGFSLWVCWLQKTCLYVVDGNSDSRGCDQFVLIKILPTCPGRFEELLLLL